jgi:hypothetical protein
LRQPVAATVAAIVAATVASCIHDIIRFFLVSVAPSIIV